MRKLPAHDFLDKLGIPYDIKTFSSETEKGAANVAAALGFRERQMIKTLIFETGEGEQLLVMVGADQHIKSGKLKKATGSRNIKMAAPDTVLEVTGYRIGSIPPFCWQPEGFRTMIEASLLEEEVLGVGAGEWGNEILITPERLVKAAKALPFDIVQPSE
ncbi:aminoacyl-tRNA deacylase [Bacillus pumilus]|uniref:aminoacyl-tRNA deacylase n=1 Tax=Bacillus pumilus TaxID=1408 RepID=UPI001E2D6CF9|nr:YbaK/EbsC family protein [Bacillus pumilus]MCC9090668.1 YbaK/EbsC family protein [Bacillus pumilus]